MIKLLVFPLFNFNDTYLKLEYFLLNSKNLSSSFPSYVYTKNVIPLFKHLYSINSNFDLSKTDSKFLIKNINLNSVFSINASKI